MEARLWAMGLLEREEVPLWWLGVAEERWEREELLGELVGEVMKKMRP